jgi:AcrR family transcriptional regulator
MTQQPKRNARERILEAALVAFRTQGYARTTTQHIASQAGVAEVTLFRHFQTKQTLFEAVVGQMGSTATLNEIEANITGDLYNDLRVIGRALLGYFSGQRDTIAMLMFESTHFPEMQNALVHNAGHTFHLLHTLFEQEMAAGRIREQDVRVLVELFVSTVVGYALVVATMQPPAHSLDTMTAKFVQIFIHGIAIER